MEEMELKQTDVMKPESSQARRRTDPLADSSGLQLFLSFLRFVTLIQKER